MQHLRVYRNPFVTYTVRLLVTIIYSQSAIDINIVGVIQQCVRERIIRGSKKEKCCYCSVYERNSIGKFPQKKHQIAPQK